MGKNFWGGTIIMVNLNIELAENLEARFISKKLQIIMDMEDSCYEKHNCYGT